MKKIKIIKIKFLIIFTGLSLLFHTPYVFAVPAPQPNWYFTIMAEIGQAKIDGFSQIPRGGDPGSTTLRQPNFSEMGKRHDTIHTLGCGIQYNQYQLWYKSTPIHFQQKTTLQNSLNTHGQVIDMGDYFNLKMETRWQAVILEKKIDAIFDILTIMPYVEFDYIKYLYYFTRIDGAGSTRGFANTAGRVGIKLEYRFHPMFSLEAQTATTLPFSHITLINANLNLRLHLIEHSYAVSTPYVGIGYIELDSSDKQSIANHLRYQAKPYLYAGIEIALI